jgi:hypothetical protein
MRLAFRSLSPRFTPAVAKAGSATTPIPARADGERGLPRDTRPRAVCPIWARLFDVASVSPLTVGVLIAVAFFGAFLALDILDGNLASLVRGEIPFWRHVEVRSAIVVATLLAAVVVTSRYADLGTRRDLERLAPQLDHAALPESVRASFGAPAHPAALRAAGVVGAVVILAIVPTLYLDPTRFLYPATYAWPSVIFDLLVGAVLGWTVFRTLFAALEEDRRFAALAKHVRSINLLDLAPLYVFGRRGLRRALCWLCLVSLAALVFVDAGNAEPPALVLGAIFGFATISFLLPIWGAHRCIRAQKLQELATVRRQIQEERERLRAANWCPAEATGAFTALLGYEARVREARTWPLDASTIVRLALYGLLPIGSWLGSAFIDRFVQAWLG